MDRGTLFSGIGHLGLILWVILGDWLFAPADLPPIAVAQVAMVSEAEFAAMVAAAPAMPADAPVQPSVAVPEPVQPELPVEAPAPEPVVVPVPAPAPEPDATLPVAEVPQPLEAPEPVAPVAEAEQPVPVPLADKRPKPRPIDRVAPEPVDVATDAPEIADVPTPEVTDTPAEELPVAEVVEPAAAPEEATTQIVTEAVETEADAPQLAPTSSRRPQSRPERVAVAEPEADPVVAADPEADAIAAALAEAVVEPAVEDVAADTGGSDAPQGPPMSASEVEGLRVAINKCWNVGQLSSEALRVTVTLRVEMLESGKPDNGTIEMTDFQGGSEAAALQAFEAGRRALIRCGSKGYDLPADKFDEWKVLNLIFDPSGMRLR